MRKNIKKNITTITISNQLAFSAHIKLILSFLLISIKKIPQSYHTHTVDVKALKQQCKKVLANAGFYGTQWHIIILY